MSNFPLQYEATEVLCYSKIHGGIFNVGECISIHQWVQQKVIPNKSIIRRFKQIQKQIKNTNWIKPEIIYDSQLKLVYKNEGSINYKELILNNN